MLSSNALDSVYYKLSDLSLLNVPQSDGTTAQVFKNLTWSENQYIAGKVYANDVLMNEKLYLSYHTFLVYYCEHRRKQP